MKSIHKQFLNELINLKEFIDYGISSSKHFSSAKMNGEQYASAFNLGKSKVYNYNSYIITLYGLFERYIENIVTKYLEDLCSTSEYYDQLPETLKQNNVQKTAQLIISLTLPKNKSLNSKSVIDILNKNLSHKNPQININAFTQHSTNFRQSSINEFLKQIGITNLASEIRNVSPLRELLEVEFLDYKNQKSDIVFSIINDLSDRRNDVAHGVENISILHHSIMKEYIEYIETYSIAFYKYMYSNVLKFQYKNKSIAVEKIGVIDNRILLCELDKVKIDGNSRLIVERIKSHPKYIEVGIVKIQKDRADVESVDGLEKVKVGIEVDSSINNKNKFAIKK